MNGALVLKPTIDGQASRRPLLILATALAMLSACSHKERPESTPLPEPGAPPAAETPSSTPSVPTAQTLNARQRTARIYDLLNRGEVDQARAEVRRLQSDYPTNRSAAELMQQIDGDAKAILGIDSFAYVVQPGDTFPTLAARYLRAGSRFYLLARYNGIAVPATLQPGQTIMIPGRQRNPVSTRPARTPPPRRAPAAAGTSAATAAPALRTPRADPVRAARLRRSGLEQMSAGSIGRAVQLLQRATRLDPGNAAIAADLDRARRIQSTVQDRR